MSAKIIIVANQKGGAGKTTISMQLAGGLTNQNKRVLVIDGDPQGTALRWSTSSSDEKPFPANVISLSVAGDKIHREIKNFVKDYDFIIVDCPPAAESGIAQSSLLVGDLCLIPILPSPPDIWATVAIKDAIQRAKVINEDLKEVLVVNQFQTQTSLGQEVLNILENFGIPLLKTHIGLRTVYKECAAFGQSVFSMGTKAKTAQKEIINMTNEIIGILGEN